MSPAPVIPKLRFGMTECRAMVRRALLVALFFLACSKPEAVQAPPAAQPSILLITLDTTRADAIGALTPSINAVAARGRTFRQAYATTPQTLPAHSSMLTGLYPAGHGVHENGRYLAAHHATLAARLRERGYATAAFVSAFALARRFGLDRGFEHYDDDFGGENVERTAAQTNERVLAFLNAPRQKPLFLWVHYYDPHHPYTPPEPHRRRHARPYDGEVASMDEALGKLVEAFRKNAKSPVAIVIAGDHGEGLGEHGEAQHGNLLYQSTMHVPLVIEGPGFAAGASDAPVSTRRIFHTILDWAGIDPAHSLRGEHEPVVLGEAMKPFLDYGWQPQTMAVEQKHKTILSGGRTELYDVIADPRETRELPATNIPRGSRVALRDYPLPSLTAPPPSSSLSEEERQKLASLGYVSAGVRPVVRKDAPRPADMAHLFDTLDRASALFVREQYREAIPLLEKILADDPHNLDSALRLATAHSSLGHDAAAEAAFVRAQAIAPDSADVRTYFALHLARGDAWQRAVPMLERVVAEDPDRLPAVQALAVIRERQGRIPEAVELRQQIYAKRTPTAAELVRLGEMAMAVGNTAVAIDAFEKARDGHDLELGVLYLAARRFEDAREALDRVPRTHPGYPMALFKRAQVSVLLREPDAAQRIALAKQHADATTRELIARERLFQQ